MPFIGTVVNFAVVLVTGLLGALLRRGIPKLFGDAVMAAVAICVIYIGIDGALEPAPPVAEDSFLSAGLFKVLVMIISMVIGTLIGELCNFDSLIGKLGDKLEGAMARKFKSSEDTRGNFSRGFVSCSMLFCVGAMATSGAFQDGLGNPDLLLAKTVIDGISGFIMATTLGVGCAFAAFFLLVYQGAIAAVGFFMSAAIPASTVSYMSIVGSLIIILVGTNILGVTRAKTANMVPAMFMPILVEPLLGLIF